MISPQRQNHVAGTECVVEDTVDKLSFGVFVFVDRDVVEFHGTPKLVDQICSFRQDIGCVSHAFKLLTFT